MEFDMPKIHWPRIELPELGGYETDKFKLKAKVEGDTPRWTVAWAEDITETDVLMGVVAIGVSILSENPAPFYAWIEELMNRTINSLIEDSEEKFPDAVLAKAKQLASDIIKQAITHQEWREVFDKYDMLNFKAGAIRYSGSNTVGDHVVTSTWGMKPYIAFCWYEGNVGGTNAQELSALGIEIDHNPKSIQLATNDVNLYQLHNDGAIYEYKGSPSNWKHIDKNPKTISIAASGENLYLLHNDGSIYHYLGSPFNWKDLDHNPKSIQIVADGDNLYQLHNDGAIYEHHGSSNWKHIDKNPETISIAASGGNLYLLHNNGGIYRYQDEPFRWEEIDHNPKSIQIVADGNKLYQLHSDGAIYEYLGSPSNWRHIDNNPKTISITASNDDLYLLHSDGNVYLYLGSAFNWGHLGTDTKISKINTAKNQLYMLHSDGEIWSLH